MSSSTTLQDVADYVGVSSATVSRALNGSPSVKPETVKRIREAALELNYQPNVAARMLSGGPSDTVCLVLPSLSKQALSRFYYASLIAGAEETANQEGLHLLIKNKQETNAFFSLIDQQRVGGVLLRVGHNQSLEQRYIRRLRQAEVPFVLIGGQMQGSRDLSIYIDVIGGARALAHHFAEQGYERILYVSGPKRNADSNDRYYGFRLGLTEKGYAPEQLLVAQGDYTPESGYRAAEEHLRRDAIDAVFAATDHTALGVLTYCAARRISVPGEIAVAGYDDQDYAAYTFPSLTTVRQPVYELGQHAIEQLLYAMRTRRRKEHPIILSPTLVVRDSTLRIRDGKRPR